VVYICAAGHCGSTLLDMLIGSHSRAASLGEIAHLPKNLALNTLCSCGRPVRGCPLWNAVLEGLGERFGCDYERDPYALVLGYPNPVDIVDPKRHTAFYRVRRRMILGLRYAQFGVGSPFLRSLVDRLDPTVRHSFALYDLVRSHLGVDWVVDSSKSYVKAIALYRSDPDRVRVILLSRDGRGVLYSMLKRRFGKQQSIRNWKRYYQRCATLLDRHVDSRHLLKLRYEEIVTRPSVALTRICDWLAFPYEPTMLDFAAQTHHITNGNNMRFAQNSVIRADLEWQDLLQRDDRADFQRVAGDLNARLGYE